MKLNCRCIVILMAALSGMQPIYAAISPVFNAVSVDDSTADNQFKAGGKQHWFIAPGADSYQDDLYERPTSAGFKSTSKGYGASKYFANLDIVTTRAGYDSRYMYVEINMAGNYFHKDDNSKDFEGLKYQYGFRFSDDANGAGGYLIRAEFSDPNSQADWTAQKTEAFQDSDGDVGGLGGLYVTRDDGDTVINGYDDPIISDGKIGGSGQEVLFVRMVGNNTVQLALDYAELNLDMDYVEGIQYLDMQAIKGGPVDPQNYFGNDKYTSGEAGNPYSPNEPGNIYGLDTARGSAGFVPEPGTLGLMGLVFLGLNFTRRLFLI